MQKAIIDKVQNGYVVTITKPGNQTVHDHSESYIAKDIDEAIRIIKDNE